jgi:two-component system sensor histidine kinase PilS (NtrC family)
VKRKLKEELRSTWFVPLRLAIFLLLFGAVMLPQSSTGALYKAFLPYSLTTLLFLIVAEIKVRSCRPWLLSVAIFVHLAAELIVEGTLIEVSGQMTTQYSILFLLTIISASLVFRLAGTLAIGTLASLLYAMRGSLHDLFASGTIAWNSIGETFTTSDDVYYATFLHICTFYLVAFVSGYLAQRLRAKEGELSTTSRRLERARLDTDDILQNLHSGILTLDNRGEIVYFNRAAESILGYRQEEVKGRSFLKVLNRRMPEFAERILSVLKHSRPSFRTELTIADQDGNELPLGLTTSLLGDEREGVRGVIAIFQDLTTAKQMERALMKADRLAAIGELSARIAHEIRNPLASISGSVEVLNSELQVQGENARLMELIVKESERLSRVLTNFLSYSRTDQPVHSKVELMSVVSETLELMRHDDDLPPTLQLRFRSEFTTAYVIADEDQLRQVLINLIANAVQAVKVQSGVVELIIGDPDGWDGCDTDDWVAFTVADNGCGFDPRDRDKIFEPFFSQRHGGSGLGLAIVKRCLDNIGGRIRVRTGRGTGTSFELLFRRYCTGTDESKPTEATSDVSTTISTS